MIPRIVVVPGPSLAGGRCSEWGMAVAVRPAGPDALVGALASGHPSIATDPGNGADPPTPAGVIIAPGPDGFDASGLAGAVASAPVPVVAAGGGHPRHAG